MGILNLKAKGSGWFDLKVYVVKFTNVILAQDPSDKMEASISSHAINASIYHLFTPSN
jgi:hypothetical protein